MCLSRTDSKQAEECQVGVEVTLSWAGHVLLPRKLAALAKGHKERKRERKRN